MPRIFDVVANKMRVTNVMNQNKRRHSVNPQFTQNFSWKRNNTSLPNSFGHNQQTGILGYGHHKKLYTLIVIIP